MVKCLNVINKSNWDLRMVIILVVYIEMYMESHLGLMLEQSWVLEIGILVVIIMARFRAYFLKVHWNLLMAK